MVSLLKNNKNLQQSQGERCSLSRRKKSFPKGKVSKFDNPPPKKISLNVEGLAHTKSIVMESSLPAGIRAKKNSLNMGG